MTEARYVPNREFWDAFVVSPRVGAICHKAASEALPLAKQLSPRSDEESRLYFESRFGPLKDPRHYADCFEVTDLVQRFTFGPRIVSRLVNTNQRARIVENAPQGRLRPGGFRVMHRVKSTITRKG